MAQKDKEKFLKFREENEKKKKFRNWREYLKSEMHPSRPERFRILLLERQEAHVPRMYAIAF